MKSQLLKPLLAAAACLVMWPSHAARAADIIVQPTNITAAPPEGMISDTNPNMCITGAGLDDPDAVSNGAPVPAKLPQHNASFFTLARWYEANGSSTFDQKAFVPGTQLTFALDQAYTINGVYLWNYSENNEEDVVYNTNRGLNEATIEFSSDGGTTWGKPVELTFKPSADGALASPEFKPLAPAKADAVRLTLLSNFGGEKANGIIGFDEIRFTAKP